MRLVDPDAGAIRVDGVDLRDLDRGALAEQAALVPQSAFLFDDTVRGNVTLGAEVGDADVWAALRTAQADGFVARLPYGLDSRLGERGTTLSGGQRQRLSLARALVRRPRLLVLDDATSAVDPEVEQRILAAMRSDESGLDEATTMLLVAYRKATIALADEVVYLADGRVVDRGTHDELLARNAAYARLVNAYEQRGGLAVSSTQPRPRGLQQHRRSPPATRSPRWPTLRRGIAPLAGAARRAAGAPSCWRCSAPPGGSWSRSRCSRPSTAGSTARRHRLPLRAAMAAVAAAGDRGDRGVVVPDDLPAVHAPPSAGWPRCAPRPSATCTTCRC